MDTGAVLRDLRRLRTQVQLQGRLIEAQGKMIGALWSAWTAALQASDVDVVNVSRPRLEAVEGGGDQDQDGRRGHLRAV